MQNSRRLRGLNGSNGSSRSSRAAESMRPPLQHAAGDGTTDVPAAEFVRVLLRHKKKAFASFISIVALTLAAVVFYPRQYLSEAKLFVRVGRETATLDPTATTGHTVAVQRPREREINSIYEILQSQLILERAVDAMGVEAPQASSQIHPHVETLLRPLKQLKQQIDDLDPISDRERAILLARKRLRFSAPDTSDVLTVSAKAESPQAAQSLVEHVLEAFFSLHGRLGRSPGGYEFFEQQAALLHEQLSSASAALRDAKNRYGVLTIDGQRDILNTQIGSIEAQVGQLDGELAYAKARSADLKDSLASVPSTIVSESVTGIGHEATDRMRTQLYDLQIREKELSAQYNNNHPYLVAIRQQLENVNQIFQQEPPQRTQTKVAVHETHQKLNVDLLSEKATITALESKRQSLETRRGELREELKALNGYELQIAELESQVEMLRVNYKSYVERREEARIDQALAQERISSIDIVQPATLSDQPVTPRKLPLLAVGLMCAFSGAVCLVIAAEYFDSSFVTPAQVERQIELPVLVSIPRAPLKRQHGPRIRLIHSRESD